MSSTFLFVVGIKSLCCNNDIITASLNRVTWSHGVTKMILLLLYYCHHYIVNNGYITWWHHIIVNNVLFAKCMWLKGIPIARAQCWREFAKCRFTNFPSFFFSPCWQLCTSMETFSRIHRLRRDPHADKHTRSTWHAYFRRVIYYLQVGRASATEKRCYSSTCHGRSLGWTATCFGRPLLRCTNYFAMLKYLHPTANCLTRPADSRMLDFIPAKAVNCHGSFQIGGDYCDIFWSKVQHMCVCVHLYAVHCG